jgi:hypothetical protein
MKMKIRIKVEDDKLMLTISSGLKIRDELEIDYIKYRLKKALGKEIYDLSVDLKEIRRARKITRPDQKKKK